MTAVEDFLEHHGVRGMKWGQHLFGRRGGSGGSSAHPVKMGGKPAWHSPPPKKAPVIASQKVKRGVFGRSKQSKVLSEEAKQLHEIRIKAKKHGIHSLTNKELEIVNKRLELQQKFQKAHPKKKNPLVDLLLDSVLSDQGSAKIKTILESKGAHKNVIDMVGAAIALNRTARKK